MKPLIYSSIKFNSALLAHAPDTLLTSPLKALNNSCNFVPIPTLGKPENIILQGKSDLILLPVSSASVLPKARMLPRVISLPSPAKKLFLKSTFAITEIKCVQILPEAALFIDLLRVFLNQIGSNQIKYKFLHANSLVADDVPLFTSVFDKSYYDLSKNHQSIDLGSWWQETAKLALPGSAFFLRDTPTHRSTEKELLEVIDYGLKHREQYYREWAEKNNFINFNELLEVRYCWDSAIQKAAKKLEALQTNPSPMKKVVKLLGNSSGAELGLLAGSNSKKQAAPQNIRSRTKIVFSDTCIKRGGKFSPYKLPGHPLSYTLTKSEVLEFINQSNPAEEISLTSGLNPELLLDDYLDIIRSITKSRPFLSAFSADEILFYSELKKISVGSLLKLLVDSGLKNLSSYGCGLLVQHKREAIKGVTTSSDEWLGIHQAAHSLGIKSIASLVHSDDCELEMILCHLEQLRNLQVGSNGFLGLEIYFPNSIGFRNIELQLKIISLAKIYLDNFPKITVVLSDKKQKKRSRLAFEFGADEVIFEKYFPEI